MTNKDIRNYLRNYVGFFIGACIFGVFTVLDLALVISSLLEDGVNLVMMLSPLLFAGMCALLTWFVVSEKKKLDADMAKLSGDPTAAEDFANAAVMLNGNLRLGNRYVFGKKSGRVLTYEELIQAYIYVHKTNGIEDERKLKVVDRFQQTVELCKLKTRGRNEEELKQAIAVMLMHNPAIKLGYK